MPRLHFQCCVIYQNITLLLRKTNKKTFSLFLLDLDQTAGQSENYQVFYFSPLLTSPHSLWKFPNPSLGVVKGIHFWLEMHIKVLLTFCSVITNPVNRSKNPVKHVLTNPVSYFIILRSIFYYKFCWYYKSCCSLQIRVIDNPVI